MYKNLLFEQITYYTHQFNVTTKIVDEIVYLQRRHFVSPWSWSCSIVGDSIYRLHGFRHCFRVKGGWQWPGGVWKNSLQAVDSFDQGEIRRSLVLRRFSLSAKPELYYMAIVWKRCRFFHHDCWKRFLCFFFSWIDDDGKRYSKEEEDGGCSRLKAAALKLNCGDVRG